MDSLPAMLIDENKALKARIEKLEEALMRIEIVADIERGDPLARITPQCSRAFGKRREPCWRKND